MKEAKPDATLDEILSTLKTTGKKVKGAPEEVRRIDLCKAYEVLTGEDLACS